MIFADRAFGTATRVALVTALGLVSFLAPGTEQAHGSGLGAFWYVVERTLANLGGFRRVRLCYERTPAHFQALSEISACCLVATRLKQYETSFEMAS